VVASHPEAELEAAAARLRGHLVQCPVIGDLCLPGLAVPAGLRLKAELLQPGGSLWYRGAQHWLLRQFGRWKGFCGDGCSAQQLMAWARAARDQRAQLAVRLPAGTGDELRSDLAALGCSFLPAVGADPSLGAVHAGYVPLPPSGEPDFLLGVATVALELAAELPDDVSLVVVAPAELAGAVAAGARMLGRGWQVQPAPPTHPRADDVRRGLSRHHRLCTAPEGAAALAFALEGVEAERTCVVLGT